MISFYFDDDSGSRSVMRGLERLGYEVTRSIEAGTAGWSDTDHLAFAAERGLTLVTANRRDFVILHRDYMAAGREHAGIIVAVQGIGIGERIRRLDRLARHFQGSGLRDHLEFLGDWGEEQG